MSTTALLIVNLNTGANIVFQYFPPEITTTAHANWQPQDTAFGVKPLLYANTDPRKLEFELWLDGSIKGESITPQINELLALLNVRQFAVVEKGREVQKFDAPPALAVLWGDRQEKVVLEEIRVTETYFETNGVPVRAKVNLSFIQTQYERARTMISAPPPEPPMIRGRTFDVKNDPRFIPTS